MNLQQRIDRDRANSLLLVSGLDFSGVDRAFDSREALALPLVGVFLGRQGLEVVLPFLL